MLAGLCGVILDGMSQPSPHELLIDGPGAGAAATLVLAHGAGAGMESDFMNAFAAGLAADGLQVVRFEFPYMREHRTSGKSRPPDREPVLRQAWHDVIRSLKVEPRRLFIGGKSMGGRVASLIADETGVAGLICLGYPFHPTGKPNQLRIEHLKTIRTPTLILQGERDPFGSRDEVAGYQLSQQVALHWLTDGDHSLVPRKSSGRTQQQNWDEAIGAIRDFLQMRLQ